MREALFDRWPRSVSPVLTQARLRVRPEDFQVEEIMPHVPEGRGEHLWLKVRKRGLDTEQVVRELARRAGLRRREVSHAGRKDRHAVCVQWFSLHLPGRADPVWSDLPDGIEIVQGARHSRKLRTGALSGNCFTIVLRDCVGEAVAVQARVEQMREQGVPNYFGEQRFGRDGGNIDHARALFAGRSVRDPALRGLYLSAARSFLFNEVLAARVRAASWNTLLPGEACQLAGRRSYFVADEMNDTLQHRLREHDIHPSGPLWGRGEPPSHDVVRALETAIASHHADLAAGLAAAGLEQERRALRLIPQNLAAEPLSEGSWQLRFCLPAGSYATSVVRALADYSLPTATLLEDEPA